VSADLISLDEASRRLEHCDVSGRMFVELLVEGGVILHGTFPGSELRRRIDLSRVTSFRAAPRSIIIADEVRWTEVILDWNELKAAFGRRGYRVDWSFAFDITTEMLERAKWPRPTRRLLDNLRPPAPLPSDVPALPRRPRRARAKWFEGAVSTAAVPAPGEAPRARRGPRSGKRENTVAAMRQDLRENKLTAALLGAMREKQLAARYCVSRDTARKARRDVLSR
jgi:hypothetical protein